MSVSVACPPGGRARGGILGFVSVSAPVSVGLPLSVSVACVCTRGVPVAYFGFVLVSLCPCVRVSVCPCVRVSGRPCPCLLLMLPRYLARDRLARLGLWGLA